jgi:hypothetical protein
MDESINDNTENDMKTIWKGEFYMRKMVALLLSGILIASTVPNNSFAAVNITSDKMASTSITKGEPSGGITQDPSSMNLEAAIKAVKAKITIPGEYSEFNYYFYNTSSYVDSYWSFTWRNPKSDSFIQISCDKDYHITYYANYNYSQRENKVSVFLKKELKSTADSFIKQIAPEISSKLEFVDASYEGIYSSNYRYQYQRKENGVILPDNTVTISVNSITGNVTSASINWLYNEPVPSSSVKLTKEEAAKLLKDQFNMKLVYRTDYAIYYDYKYGYTNTSKKAFLVYEPTQNYISVDAKTGKIYLTRNEWVERNMSNESAKAEDSITAGTGSFTSQLTEQEAAKVEDLKNLITKETALKAVISNKYLLIDKSLTSNSVTLYKMSDGNGKDSYAWYISLSDPRPVNYEKDQDTYRAYANAMVDAKTGKIINFYTSVKNYYDAKNQKWNSVKIPYDKEKSREVLEKFLNSETKDYFKNTILVNTNDDYVAYYKNNTPVYGGYNYQYNRVYEGIEYPYNGIYGSVDGVSGKVYSFSTNWDTGVVFESPKGAMTPEKAMEYYLSNEGFGLKYEINTINTYSAGNSLMNGSINQPSVDYEIRLVYRPDVNPSYISPFTGEQLNYNGEVYKKSKPYQYLDIADTPENKDILLLADMNIGFEGDYFNPNSPITIGEVNSLLDKIGYGYVISEDNSSSKLITREEMAYNFIVKLGLEKMSKINGIYKTGYADETAINQQYLGAVALAKGLGLMDGDSNNNFNPIRNITRAEAVHLLLSFIKVQNGGIYY